MALRMAANRRYLIGSLILSFSILLCPAAPLDTEDEDDTNTSPDWPVQVRKQYELSSIEGIVLTSMFTKVLNHFILWKVF